MRTHQAKNAMQRLALSVPSLTAITMLLSMPPRLAGANTTEGCYTPSNLSELHAETRRSNHTGSLLALYRDRVDEKIGGLGLALRVKQTLCRDVVVTILDSDLHLAEEEGARVAAVRALAGAEGEQQVVVYALEEALSRPLNANLSDVEIRRRRRLEELFPGLPQGPEDEYPASENVRLVNAVATVASQLDKPNADKIAELVRPLLHRQLYVGGNGPRNDGVILLIASSSLGEEIAAEMFEWAEEGVPLYSGLLAKVLATLRAPSPDIQRRARDRCMGAVGEGGPGFSAVNCDALLAKWGDSEALTRLGARLYDGRIPGWLAADRLLNDIGHEGIPLLRRALFSESLVAATRAAAVLCQLGPDAGQGVIVRVKELAAALPDDEQIARSLKRCDAEERTATGSFVELGPD